MQVLGLIFVTMIGTVVGLTCYQCNSHEDTACNDFFSAESDALRDTFAVTCPPSNSSEPPLCRKTKMYIYKHNDSKVRVYRECGYAWRSSHGNHSCYPVRSEDYDIEVCQCYGDNCNTAPHLGLWAPLLLGASVVGLAGLFSA